MPKAFLRWLFIGAVMFVFTACHGGGGSSVSTSTKDKVVLNSDLKSIDLNLSKSISKIEFEDNNTKLIVSDKFTRGLKKGDIVNIPVGVDDRFPIGFSGRINEIDKDGNSSKVSISNDIGILDIVDELDIKEQTISLTADNLIGVIIPSYVTASKNAKSRNLRGNAHQKVFLDGGIVVSNRGKYRDDKGYFEKAKLEFDTELKLPLSEEITKSKTTKKEIKFNLTGSLTDIKVTFKPKISILTGGVAIKTMVSGNLKDVDLSTTFNGEFVFGHFKEKWKEFEASVSKTLGIQLTGLSSDDKIGKYPIAGFMYSLENLTKLKLEPDELKSINDLNKLNDKLAIILWVYFDAKVGLVVEGKLGLKSNVNFQFGVDKKESKKAKDNKIFKPIDKDTPVFETYVSGKIGIDGKLGFSTDVDLFFSGIRFVNLGMFVGGKFKQELELKSDGSKDAKASYYLQNFDDGTKWKWKFPNMLFCDKGSVEAGVLFNVDFSIGGKLEKELLGHKIESSSNLKFHDQYPRQENMDNLKAGERTGTWWKMAEWGECYNIPTPTDLDENHIDNYRKPIDDEALKTLSDENYKYAYLANRIYDDKETTGMIDTIIDNSLYLTIAKYILEYKNIYKAEDKRITKNSWKTMDVAYNEVNGFKAGLYKNIYTGEYIVSYGGTTANSVKNVLGKNYDKLIDAVTDMSLLGMFSLGQPYQALSYLDRAKKIINKDGGGEISAITGHSLGGGLAQYAGLYSGIKTVTFNTAPLPYNYLASAISFTNKIDLEFDGLLNSVKFRNADKITNIMTPYDPVSTISTAIMSLDDSNMLYLSGVRFISGIPPTQKMDYLITGKQIFIPVENQGGLINFDNHSMDLIEDVFLENTNYTVDFDLVQSDKIDKDNISLDINNLVVKDSDNNQMGIADISSLSWELKDKSGTISKGTSKSTITIPKDNQIYGLINNIQLKDGRVISKLIFTTPPPANLKAIASTEAITLHWDSIDTISAYKICLSQKEIKDGDSCEDNGGELIPATSTTEVIDTLKPNIIYHFRVRAISNGYKALWSDEITKSLKEEEKSYNITISLKGDQTKEESKSTVFPIFRTGDDSLIDTMECSTDKSLEITNTKVMARVEIPSHTQISEFHLSCIAYDIDKNKIASDTILVSVGEKKTTTIKGSQVIKKTGQTKSYKDYDDGYYQAGVTPSYSRSSDGIVTDNITGLMWQDNESIQKPWVTQENYDNGNYNDTSGDTASTYCANLSLGGYSNWRLPTVKELLYIVDNGKYDPAIDNQFQNTISNYYWSAPSYASSSGNAWAVYFYSGSTSYYAKSTA